MRRPLGTLLATLALAATAGCGTTSSTTASDGSSTPPSTHPSSGPVPGATVTLISVTGPGGSVSRVASALNTDAQVAAFVRRLRAPALRHQVTTFVAKQGRAPDSNLYGAVVAVGCDRPPGAVVMEAGGQITIVPREVASPLPECLAPVTTVALAVLPQS